MAIRQIYEMQTDIPGGLREHFTEHDGRWFLQADPPIEDVANLKSALDKERGMRRDVEKQLVDWKTRYEGIDPDEHRKLQDRVKGLDESEVYDRQGIEALVTRRTETMKSEHDRVLRLKDNEISNLRENLGEMSQRWKTDRIRTALLNAVDTAGVYTDAREDAVSRGLAVFTDLDEHGNVVAKNGEELRYGKDGVNPLSPSEWISNLKAEGRARHLWPPSAGSGAPVTHGANGQNIDWAALPPAERLTRYRELQQSTPRR